MKASRIHSVFGIKGTAAALFVLAALTACGKKGDTMVITGGQEYIYAPRAGEEAKSEPFAVVSGEGENARTVDVSWTILSSGEGVSVSPEGVVTITDAYVAGDINGTDILLQASFGEAEEEKLTVKLHVREAQRVEFYEIEFPDAVKKGQYTDIILTNCRDQYGEPMEAPGAESVRWETSDDQLVVKDGRVGSFLPVTEPAFAAVRATVDGVMVEKRFIVYAQEGYQPDAETLERLAKAQIKILQEIDFSVAREVDASSYVYIDRNLKGKTELSVDVSKMVCHAPDALYQVTVLHEDGSVTGEEMRAGQDGKLQLQLNGAAAVEVSPVLKFSLGKSSLKDTESYVHVAVSEKYTGTEDYGFYGEVGDTTGGVQLRGEASMFVCALPDGFYSIRITKPGTGRATVRINGASQGTNVGNPGSGGRSGTRPYVYLMEDVRVEGGVMRLSFSEKDFTLGAVEIRKTPEIIKRRVHVYIGGDSTVSNYYPIETSEPEPGRYQTGWGQVFAQYVTEETVVTNIAGGGTYAKSWYEMAFPGVVQNGQPGDFFLLQAGINDRTYSNIDEMVQYLNYMIDACQEKGITVVLLTAMQSCKFWKDAKGTELGEFGKPEGSGLAAFMDAIRDLAEKRQVFLVDTGKLTGEWYSVVGRTYVAQNYHIYNARTGVEEDTLHLSYHGAKKVAELIATDLAGKQAAGAADGQGHTLKGLTFHEIVTYDVTHKDSEGNEVTTPVTAVKAVYKRYAQ